MIGLIMKRNVFISIVMVIFSMAFNHANAQELTVQPVTIENKIGRITWLFANRVESSVIFYNFFKDLYVKDNELYEYDLNDPTDVEQIFIELFAALHKDFFDCYNDPEEEQKIVMGFIEDDQITEFQVYILATGFRLETMDVNFVYIHNTVNDEQALFCNIEN